MPEYTIEMLWRCRFCQESKNKGLSKHCLNCGHPKDTKDEELFPADTSQANAIVDADKLREADAPGPNWDCRFCGSLQSALNKCCTECGCDRATGSRLWTAKIKTLDVETGVVTEDLVEVPKAAEIPDVPTPNGAATAGQAVRDDTLPPPPKGYREPPVGAKAVREVDTGWPPKVKDVGNRPRWEPIDDDVRRFKEPSTNLVPLLAVAGVAVAIFLGWLLFRTRIVDATVTGVSWDHTVVVDRYHLIDDEGWDVPSDAVDQRSMGQREHHKDHVKVGSHKELHDVECNCKTVPSCQTVKGTCKKVPGKCRKTKIVCGSTGKGTARCSGGDEVCAPDTEECGKDHEECGVPTRKCGTCTEYKDVDDYEDRPVLREWHAWRAWGWTRRFRNVPRSGHSMDTCWPTDAELVAPLAPGEQERSYREESYQVIVTDEDKDTHKLTPRSETEFQRYAIGTKLRIKVGVAGGAQVLSLGQ